MSIVLVGGMDRIERHYVGEAGKLGIDLKVFSNAEAWQSGCHGDLHK